MSSLNIKQGSDAHFSEYPLASPSNNEIDLLNLIEVLWRAKKTVMAVVFAFACAGLLISFILPQKMDQLSRYYSRRSHSVAGPGENLYQTPRS